MTGTVQTAPVIFLNYLMKTTLLCSVILLAGAGPLLAADAVELNGITCLFQQKLGCFLLYQPAATQPLNFTLAEGESKYGFKLISVDAPGHQVLLEKCGVRKVVHINATPDIISAATVAGTLEASPVLGVLEPFAAGDAKTLAKYLASPEAASIQSGHPPVAGFSSGAANLQAGPSGASSFSSGDTISANNANVAASAGQNLTGAAGVTGGSTGDGTTPASSSGSTRSSQTDLASQPWYEDSVSVEQSRLMTANAVLNGTALPFPETPLTPSTVDPRLVGPGKLFPGHYSTFQNGGSPYARSLNYN